MAENVFVFCNGKRVIAHQLDGWWRCGCCGRRLYEIDKTWELAVEDARAVVSHAQEGRRVDPPKVETAFDARMERLYGERDRMET